jgi:hypothetical protein
MPSPGELYIAHFLGPKGAERMFTAGLADPDQVAAALFPKQAKANPTIFYEDGQARTIRQVYKALVQKHEGGSAMAGADAAFAAQQLAGDPMNPAPLAFGPGSKWPAAQPLPSRFSQDDMSFTGLFSTEAAPIQPRVLMSPQDESRGSSAFFTQLYGQ